MYNLIRLSMVAASLVAASLVAATAGAAQAQVCVKIDESHDTLDATDRSAALLMLNKQFAIAGEAVAAECSTPYTVAHVKLGNTITVTLSGPKGNREGMAIGLDDLPALYNQMVRSLETGRPMTGLNVTDRTNVTEAQSTANRVHSDGFSYARLGYAGIFGDSAYGTPSFGLGYRAELDKVAIDISFLNFQVGTADYYSNSSSATGASVIKLSGLYLLNGKNNSTPYFGGGLSWGATTISGSRPYQYLTPSSSYTYTTGGSGNGLQGELTAGYEFARATTIRMFAQADAILPFYSIQSDTITTRGYTTVVTSSTHRYVPSLVMSIGLGWQRNRK